HWVERIFSAGKRLASTVERMLKLVRSDDLSRPLDVRVTPLEPFVRGVVGEMGPFLEARGQRVDFDLDPALGDAEIDAAKVGDVLSNLLINAVKFTPDGGTIRVSGGPNGPDRVRFVVADQGTGIDPALRPFLFEPFFTGFDTMHHSSGDFEFGKRGIGLGLSLVRRFVELHGGEVDVVSTPGAGSTFTVTLPRRAPGPGPLKIEPESRTEPDARSDGSTQG
ncbi:MAG: HAMP domain-containing histidine kinase, partial [Planctomycetia bacterium]|nr:HAMP domain-containing histidine kinase [Planctomycetia bacterium]